jgi:hypothetical protein
MRRLFAGLIVIAVAAGVLAWFAQGVAVGEDPGESGQGSWDVMTAEMPEDLYTFGQAGAAELLPQDKYEDFEGPWPNDWLLIATHNKFWGPNKCLAYEGSYDGWVEAVGPDGHPSHTDSPACTSPTGYNDEFESWMVYGPFSLEGKTEGGVSLQILIDTEYEHDWFGAFASTAPNCEDVVGVEFSGTRNWGDSGGWIEYPPEYLDFADWPGLGNILDEPHVCVAFIFHSDSNHTGPADMGAFVDNINIWSRGDVTPELCHLTMEVSPPGSGTTVPSEGTHTYTCDTTVNVSATPAAGYKFSHWSDDCSGTSPSTSVYLDTDKSCTANFSPITPTPDCPVCGDVDCDEDVDAVDAMFILQYVVGLRDQLCVPCCPGP